MKCPNCGTETNERVCPNCGANFEKAAKKTTCPNCGTETTETVCPNCGADFTKAIKKPNDTTRLEETAMCPRCGAQNNKQAEQCARCGAKIEPSPLESFLNCAPTVKIRERQPKKPSGFSSEMKKPVWKREWPTWAKVLTFIAGIVLIILGIFLMCGGCSSGEKEDATNERRIEYTWKAEAYIQPLDEY